MIVDFVVLSLGEGSVFVWYIFWDRNVELFNVFDFRIIVVLGRVSMFVLIRLGGG